MLHDVENASWGQDLRRLPAQLHLHLNPILGILIIFIIIINNNTAILIIFLLIIFMVIIFPILPLEAPFRIFAATFQNMDLTQHSRLLASGLLLPCCHHHYHFLSIFNRKVSVCLCVKKNDHCLSLSLCSLISSIVVPKRSVGTPHESREMSQNMT